MPRISSGLLELRELHGPYGEEWGRFLDENQDHPEYRAGFIPDWFLIKMMQGRLAEAARRAQELMPPPRIPAEDDDLELRVELAALAGALTRISSFIDYGAQSDPVGARERVLAALLGHRDDEVPPVRAPRSVSVRQTLGDVGPGATVIGYDGRNRA